MKNATLPIHPDYTALLYIGVSCPKSNLTYGPVFGGEGQEAG
jgi:hypothetical protein